MLTTMTEEDWTIVLQVFVASRSRRGDKGRDDRKFLEALHYFMVHNITWRALPAEFGHWNSVWKRFWRLSRSGIFEAFFDALAAMSGTAHLVQMFNSTIVRAHVSAAGAKGGRKGKLSAAHAADFSTKIHLKTDFGGLPLGISSDRRRGQRQPQLRDAARHRPGHHPARRARRQGLRRQRRTERRRAAAASAPPSRTESNAKDKPAFFPKTLYKGARAIEQAVGKFKRFKRLALRCEKTAQNYASFVALASAFILIKSVHTT